MSSSMRRSAVVLVAAIGALSACAHGGASRPTPEADTPTPKQEGAVKKANVVSSETIANSSGQPIEKILADRVAGVRLGHASDGSLTVQIRGAGGLSDAQPLYVIDGVPITPGPGGSLSGINPYDIASIEVLKDAVSTSMYGSRGAHGVILIKMKKP